jgi:NAD(P)-dependent dehydrogenase (short-subunit alcohol dehydrogenase family)
VVVADIAVDAAERVAAAIAGSGGMATARRVDVTREQDVAGLVEETAAVYGHLHYQFNNAGIAIGGDARDLALSSDGSPPGAFHFGGVS